MKLEKNKTKDLCFKKKLGKNKELSLNENVDNVIKKFKFKKIEDFSEKILELDNELNINKLSSLKSENILNAFKIKRKHNPKKLHT